MKKTYFAYLARCNDHSLYAGSTDNLKKREERHNAGRGSRYTRARLPITIVYFETFPTRRAAMQRERQLKKYRKPAKEKLIQQNPQSIKP